MGSNLGDRGAYLAAALDALEQLSPGIRVSSIYESEPVGYADQPLFWNMAAAIRWSGEPKALLETLQRIERRIGRRRRFRNGPREIDIDILDFAGLSALRSGPSRRDRAALAASGDGIDGERDDENPAGEAGSAAIGRLHD